MRGFGAIKALGLSLALGLAACADGPSEMPPQSFAGQGLTDEEVDAKVAELLAAMSTERKVAHLIMPDISAITPEDMEEYRFGMFLNGGNSGPGGDDLAPGPEWLELADAMWEASTQPLENGEPVIPALWATDAVHGHANIPGATVFPHNIGLGAANDPELMVRIGKVTAAETAITGIDWTFAPTLAVVTDTRWGRTYESFSSDPAMVGELGRGLTIGLQGEYGTDEFLDETRVIATAKHWFGDGGTNGLDQGNTTGELDDLVATHASPYTPSLVAGAMSVMASFNSINGEKMHGHGPLLDDLLREEFGFAGLTVGDWNGHAQVAGCSNDDCAAALNAGLDVFMVPEDWKGLYETLLAQVADGTVSMERLDEAVSRMLRLKVVYGAFSKPRPSERALGGKFDMLGSAEHRAVAREAVRKSLVLLENDGVLPLKANANVLVAGSKADDVVAQSGGWTVTWQGGGELSEANMPGATSIFDGIAEALSSGGGTATLSVDGNYSDKPDVAIVVFGEEPYAEFVGDMDDLILRDEEGLELLRKYRADGIRTVAVLLTGRPLWMNREIDAADAFVVAWLPGSEGGGVADLLVSNDAGYDFTGRLSFDWPTGCTTGSRALMPRGAGLSLSNNPGPLAVKLECAELSRGAGDVLALFDRGMGAGTIARAEGAELPGLRGSSPGGVVTVRGVDLNAQEDARMISWAGAGSVTFDFSGAGKLPENAVIDLTYAGNERPEGEVSLNAGGTSIDFTSSLILAQGKGPRTARIPLSCFGDAGVKSLSISATAPAEMLIARLRIIRDQAPASCEGPF